MGEEIGLDQEIVPIVTGHVSTEQGELHGDRVPGIHGNADDILSHPEQDDGGFNEVVSSPEVVGENEGDEDLEE